MRQNVLERRVELLKMEGLGVSRPDIVKQLSQKYDVSPRMVNYGFQRRTGWQGLIQEISNPERLLLKIVNRHEQIYQRAAFMHLSADNDNAKIGALRVMLEANKSLAETTILSGIMKDLDGIKQHLEKQHL